MGDPAAGLQHDIEPADERSEASGFDHDDIALKYGLSGPLMRVAGQDHVEFRHFPSHLPRDRQPGMRQADDEIGIVARPQRADEFA